MNIQQSLLSFPCPQFTSAAAQACRGLSWDTGAWNLLFQVSASAGPCEDPRSHVIPN